MYLCKGCDNPIEVSTRWNGEAFEFEFRTGSGSDHPRMISHCPGCGEPLVTLEDLRFCEMEEVPAA